MELTEELPSFLTLMAFYRLYLLFEVFELRLPWRLLRMIVHHMLGYFGMLGFVEQGTSVLVEVSPGMS